MITSLYFAHFSIFWVIFPKPKKIPQQLAAVFCFAIENIFQSAVTKYVS